MKIVFKISGLTGKVFLFTFIFLYYSNCFSQNIDSAFIIRDIKIEGNKKTIPETILRELTFKVNDTIEYSELINKLKISKENLLNKPLFNYVDILIDTISDGTFNIAVKVEERWYLWPEAAVYYVDRNFSNWLKERDLSRTDIGLGLVKYNFRGRNEKLTFYTFFGYDEEIVFYYDDLYFDKNRKHSLSFNNELLRRHETGCIIENDKLKQIYFDDEYAMKSVKLSFTYKYRKAYYNSHSLIPSFEYRSISDSLMLCNPNYLTNTGNSVKFFRIKYRFLSDKRNYRVFPTKGHKFEFTVCKNGLLIFPESNINSLYLMSDISFYTNVSEKFSINNNITLKKAFGLKNPFFLNTAFGYQSNIRGYEYYLINGRDMFISKNTIYLEVLKKKIIHLKFLPWEKFNKIHFTIYAGIYGDAAYVSNDDDLYKQFNTLQNSWLYSGGFGINILSYYDKIMRLEYSINKKGEKGLYLHFEAPF